MALVRLALLVVGDPPAAEVHGVAFLRGRRRGGEKNARGRVNYASRPVPGAQGLAGRPRGAGRAQGCAPGRGCT